MTLVIFFVEFSDTVYACFQWKGKSQWRIQDFPEGLSQPLKGDTKLLFDQFFQKTAWKLRNFGPEGRGALLAPP